MTHMPLLILWVSCSSCHCRHQLSVGPNWIHTGAAWQPIPSCLPTSVSVRPPLASGPLYQFWSVRKLDILLVPKHIHPRHAGQSAYPKLIGKGCWWVTLPPFTPWVHLSCNFSEDGSSRSTKQLLLAVIFDNASLTGSLDFYALFPLCWLLFPRLSLSSRCMHRAFDSGPDISEQGSPSHACVPNHMVPLFVTGICKLAPVLGHFPICSLGSQISARVALSCHSDFSSNIITS